MIAIKVLNTTSHYVGVLKAFLNFTSTKQSWFITLFVVNDHKPYATPISLIFFTILRLVCVHAHVKTLCARVCVFDWSKKGCGKALHVHLDMSYVVTPKVALYSLSPTRVQFPFSIKRWGSYHRTYTGGYIPFIAYVHFGLH